MNNLKKILFALFISFFLSNSASAKEDIITNVISVDTLEINKTSTIRLHGISKEIYEEYKEFAEKHNMQSDTDYYMMGESELYTIEGNTFVEEDALKDLKELLINRSVHIKKVRNDSYFVYFSKKDHYSINQLLISKGFASVDKNIISNYKMDFLKEELNAKTNNLGIWNISFKAAYSKSADSTYSEIIYILLSAFLFSNIWVLMFSMKKLSSIPSWKGLFYGFFSLLLIPFPSTVITIHSYIGAKIYLLFILLLIGNIFHHLTKFIIKHKEVLTIKKLIALMIGSVFIVISYFTFVYDAFDNPRSITVLEQGFSKENIISHTTVPEDNYLLVNNQTYFLNNLYDYLYFSVTTFFGGSYGDIVPHGNIRYIVLIEIFTSFILQMVFFGLIINIIYEKFSRNKFKYSSEKEFYIQKVSFPNNVRRHSNLELTEIPQKKNLLKETKKKTNNSFFLSIITIILILISLIKKKK
ncbi:hypothetical protein A9985_12580 [Bacillus safensis]|uniref:ion channel n=1 Tax=Bacillus safensis TaxID=561879 RepID=UPI0007FB33C0|nr:ion channel [Bacillus safensis]OBW51398.1 hypothetical protein A9985_12580 [Bacillus safensis]